MAKKAIYLYTCDKPGCGVQELGLVDGVIRVKRDGAGGSHWCLKHYPYDTCQNPFCGAKMRPFSTASADWPGTVSRGSKELCGTCRRHYNMYGTERKPGDRWTNIKGEGFRQ